MAMCASRKRVCRRRAARSAEEAAQLARTRYDAGVTDFLVVLDAEREVLANRDQWVQAQTGTATSLVAVYRALGGGWAAPMLRVSSARWERSAVSSAPRYLRHRDPPACSTPSSMRAAPTSATG